jgi:hypothetical protein
MKASAATKVVDQVTGAMQDVLVPIHLDAFDVMGRIPVCDIRRIRIHEAACEMALQQRYAEIEVRAPMDRDDDDISKLSDRMHLHRDRTHGIGADP